MINRLWEMGRSIINDGIAGDVEGRWIYVGHNGTLVLHYVLVNGGSREMIESIKVGNKLESDHLPLELSLKVGLEEKGRVDIENPQDGRSRYKKR